MPSPFTQRQVDNVRLGERRCFICMEWKPATRQFFYPDKKQNDGCVAGCIPCWKERYRSKDRPLKERREKSGLVYFVRITEDYRGEGREGWIKFGSTINLTQRIVAMRYQEKIDVELIGWIEGGLDIESKVAELFGAYKVKGREWLYANKPLLIWINRNCVLNFGDFKMPKWLKRPEKVIELPLAA
jgi:hypothetical protein